MRQRGYEWIFRYFTTTKCGFEKNDFLFTFFVFGKDERTEKKSISPNDFFPTMDADRPKKFGCQSLFTLFLIKQFPFQLLGTCEKLEVIFHSAVATTKKLTMINWIEVLEKILLLNLNRIFSWVLFHYRVRLWWSVISVNISRTAFLWFSNSWLLFCSQKYARFSLRPKVIYRFATSSLISYYWYSLTKGFARSKLTSSLAKSHLSLSDFLNEFLRARSRQLTNPLFLRVPWIY